MKCMCDIITMTLIIKVHFASSASANSDNDVRVNTTVCCPENIDSRKQVRSMDFIEVNSSVKFNTTIEHSNISGQYNSTKKFEEDNNFYHNNDDFQISDIEYNRKKELPLTIIIAGPAAALSICLFLCIAFYFHNMQLNNRAKRLSITLTVVPELNNDTNKCMQSNSKFSPQVIPPSPSPSARIPRDDMFSFSQKRKSTLTVPTLSVPAPLQHKRGSSWSAFADQEMLTLAAPRRHSTFIL